MTLLEVAMGATFLAFLGYILSSTVKLSANTHTVVMHSVTNLATLRSGAGSLRDSMRVSSDDRIELTTLGSGDSELLLQEPIDLFGSRTWGVDENELGTEEYDQIKENWKIRFTVTKIDLGGGTSRKDLVRQVIDDLLVVHHEETLVQGLFEGSALDPGFQVENVGDVWEIQIQTAGPTATTKGQRTKIHVRTRN